MGQIDVSLGAFIFIDMALSLGRSQSTGIPGLETGMHCITSSRCLRDFPSSSVVKNSPAVLDM